MEVAVAVAVALAVAVAVAVAVAAEQPGLQGSLLKSTGLKEFLRKTFIAATLKMYGEC